MLARMPRASSASSQATKRSQTAKATLGVRELVLDGELASGDRVPEVALAQRLGVSRTPLRIALATLAHEGLLAPLPGGGFVVRSFTPEDVSDAIELRGVLEGTAARLAAERLRSPDELAPLADATARLDAVLDDLSPESLARYVELNDAYHAGLVALARSPTLERAIANVVVLPFASPGALVPSQAVLPRSREILVVAQYHHRLLIEVIRRGEGKRAEEIAREHARLAQTNLDVVLEDHDALERLRGAPLLRRIV
jgi:GntR family transcriptional regulator, vanillate catabolism transcriptional regulator